AISDRGRIEMDSDGNHLLQQGRRSLHMGDAFLDGPWTKPLQLGSSLHSDSEILMPENWPVLLPCFVKKDATDRHESGGEHSSKRVGERQISKGFGTGVQMANTDRPRV